MNPEMNMKFMQIAMKHLPEGKAWLEQNGIDLNVEHMQPMLEMLMKVMTEAYELGKEEATSQQE